MQSNIIVINWRYFKYNIEYIKYISRLKKSSTRFSRKTDFCESNNHQIIRMIKSQLMGKR